MSSKLQALIVETQTKFKATPEAAKATFESRSALQDGLRSEVSIRQHRLGVDEPESLGGTDTAPNPVELILAALGSCQEITYRAYATALGIPLDNVSVTIAGDIDLRGFFGVDDSVRAGYEGIRADVHLESEASEEQLKLLREAVNAHCPVLDILTKPVPVELNLHISQPQAAAAA
jgi:putative redox protein